MDTIKIPKGTQSGKSIRLRGQGFPNVRGYGKGDQIVEIEVRTPTGLSKKQEELLEQFASLEEDRKGQTWVSKAAEKVKEALG
jgi:molecular chaperone DnaJ